MLSAFCEHKIHHFNKFEIVSLGIKFYSYLLHTFITHSHKIKISSIHNFLKEMNLHTFITLEDVNQTIHFFKIGDLESLDQSSSSSGIQAEGGSFFINLFALRQADSIPSSSFQNITNCLVICLSI